jgi:hypothetical protein
MGDDNEIMRIDVKANQELYQLIAKAADDRNCSMGSFLVGLAAKFFGRADLNFTPHKRPGRPRKNLAKV